MMRVTCTAGCGQEYDVPVTDAQVGAWKAGALIQRAMPELTPDQRELLISGTCSACWRKMFRDED